MKKNLDYLNIAKALGIICIVLGHARFPEYLWRFVSFFHVPIFFFISGIFYKDEYTSLPLIFFKKRVKSLYIPFIKYEILFLILHNLFVKLHIYDPNIMVSGKYMKCLNIIDHLWAVCNILSFGCTELVIWGFWFIQSLFTVNIIFFTICWVAKNYTNRKDELKLCLVTCCFLFGIVLAEYAVYIPRSIVSSLVGVIFFYLGYLYKRFENRIPLCAGGMFCSLLILFVTIYIYDEHIGYANHNFIRFPYFLLNACLGIYIVLYCSKLIASNVRHSFLSFIGVNSFHVLALHILSFKIVSYLIICLNNFPINYLGKYPVIEINQSWWFVYALAGVCIPTLLCFVYQKSFIKKMF